MDLDDYQRRAFEFAIYPYRLNNPEYATLGLVGEAGEIANKVKKMQRDGKTKDDLRSDIGAEIADVLWYCGALATEFGLSLDILAQNNLNKLESRQARGVLGGSGDNR